jgi:hypothetical protein
MTDKVNEREGNRTMVLTTTTFVSVDGVMRGSASHLPRGRRPGQVEMVLERPAHLSDETSRGIVALRPSALR